MLHCLELRKPTTCSTLCHPGAPRSDKSGQKAAVPHTRLPKVVPGDTNGGSEERTTTFENNCPSSLLQPREKLPINRPEITLNGREAEDKTEQQQRG